MQRRMGECIDPQRRRSSPLKPFGKVDLFSHSSQGLLGESQAWPPEKTAPLSLLGSVAFVAATRSPRSKCWGLPRRLPLVKFPK